MKVTQAHDKWRKMKGYYKSRRVTWLNRQRRQNSGYFESRPGGVLVAAERQVWRDRVGQGLLIPGGWFRIQSVDIVWSLPVAGTTAIVGLRTRVQDFECQGQQHPLNRYRFGIVIWPPRVQLKLPLWNHIQAHFNRSAEKLRCDTCCICAQTPIIDRSYFCSTFVSSIYWEKI